MNHATKLINCTSLFEHNLCYRITGPFLDTALPLGDFFNINRNMWSLSYEFIMIQDHNTEFASL